jgi:uncharacterized protein (DUF885 family)
MLVVAAAGAARADNARFDALVDQYYDTLPAARPTAATALGLHDHDADLEDYSEAGVAREVARLTSWRARFAGVAAATLDRARAADRRLILGAIDAQLLELEEVQGWRHRPDFYSSLASSAVYVIVKRSFAPLDARLKLVAARERKIPALLEAAQRNLRDVPRACVDIALDELPGIIDFLRSDVQKAFSTVKDARLLAELRASTEQAANALSAYQQFLKTKLLAKATAPFAIGDKLFAKKLAADEMIETPLPELERVGEAELHRLQREFAATAQKIDPKKPAAEVQLAIQKDHPTPETLIAETQARLAGLRRFLVEHQIVTVPSEVMPEVQETPPFMRAFTFASMDSPGPFETRATEALYNVTLPERAWTPAQVEDFLRGAFNRPLIDVVSIHEAFPGHYVQFLWIPRLASKARKIETAASNVEGWAHYTEQMMLDEGYGAGDPKLRLAQLQDALLRAARFVVGIRLHTRGMSIDQAVDFFQHEGYQSRKVAEMEARRGVEDPTYLYYTLGKLEILKLRDEYKKKLGAAFTLRKFHDALLAEGGMPLPLLRQALLDR